MNDKEKINCPVCKMKFIPRTFYPDEAIFSTHDGKKVSGFNGYISTRTVKPQEVILSSWVTYCPSCNYILRFVKEVVRKEKIITQNATSKDVSEKYSDCTGIKIESAAIIAFRVIVPKLGGQSRIM